MTDAIGERIAGALERIAAALEGPSVQAKPAEPVVTGCVNGVHPTGAIVKFGSDDEWECAAAKGGCGFRSAALVNA